VQHKHAVGVTRTFQTEYPESLPAVHNMGPEAFEQEARTALAMKLYEPGRVTSGQAAALGRHLPSGIPAECGPEAFSVETVVSSSEV
jgi:hypothetical protein